MITSLRLQTSFDLLRHAENSATAAPAAAISNIASFAETEAAPTTAPTISSDTIQFTGTGKSTKKSSLSGKLKAGIPALIITAIITGFIGLLGSVSSLLGTHLSNLFTFATDTQYAALVMRAAATGFEYAGRAYSFFDSNAETVYSHLGISRNLWANFTNSDDPEVNAANYETTMSEQFDDEANITAQESHLEKHEETTTSTNPNGTTTETTETVTETNHAISADSDGAASNASGSDARAKAQSYLTSFIQVADATCGVIKVIGMISIAVAGYELYNTITYFLSDIENVSKMMAGDGNSSAINEFLNSMTEPSSSTVTNVGTQTEQTVTGSALEASGVRLVLGDTSITSASAENYSLERLMQTGLLALGTSVTATNVCNVEKIITAIASSVITILSVGTSSIIKTVVVGIIGGVVVGAALSTVISALVPTVAQAIFSNAFQEYTGIAKGEFFAKGASAANTRVARSSSGQSLSSESAATAYNQLTQEIIAQDAAKARANLSPFDPTSEYTFLGSIISSLYPLLVSTSNIFNFSSTLTSIASTALAKLSPTYAAGTNTSYMTTFGECDLLEEIGAVGDIYCNPITTTDTSTLSVSVIDFIIADDGNIVGVTNNGELIAATDPTISKNSATLADATTTDSINQEYIDTIINKGNLKTDDDGNVNIKDNSNLEKYINYCANRDSVFGVSDYNILNDLNLSTDTVVDSILGSIPIIGDGLSAANAFIDLTNADWATGAACVNSSSNSDWDEYKYYQAYIEIDRLKAINGGESTVAAVTQQYYDEHPLDKSDNVAYLSQVSGLSTKDAEFILALIEYSDFLASYDPSSTYPFYGETTEPELISFSTASQADPQISENPQKNNAYYIFRRENYIS